MYCPNHECPDFQEDGVPGEYVDTVSVCPKCGAVLVAEWPPAQPPELENAGITVFQFIDDGRDFEDRGGMQPCTRLLVPESQSARAIVVLRETETRV